MIKKCPWDYRKWMIGMHGCEQNNILLTMVMMYTSKML